MPTIQLVGLGCILYIVSYNLRISNKKKLNISHNGDILKLKILVHVLIFHQDNKLVGNQWSPPGF